MPAAPPLSPAAEALLEQALRLPPDERAALSRCLRPAPPDADAGSETTGEPSPEFLARLEREADEVEAGLAPSYTLEEAEAEADRLLSLPEGERPAFLREAVERGRAAAAAEPGR